MIENFGRAGERPHFTLGEAPPITPVVTTAEQSSAWQTYLRGFAAKIEADRLNLLERFASMKDLYTSLGQALYDTGSGSAVWTKDREQELANINGMAKLCVQSITEAADGKRTVALINGNDWAIQQLPSDNGRSVLVNPQSGIPEIVDQAGKAVPVVGALGNPWVGVAIVAIGATFWSVVIGSTAYMVATAIEYAGSIIDRIEDARINEMWAKCLAAQAAAGKDQQFCIDAIKAIENQQVAQRKAEADKKGTPSGDVGALTSTVKWGLVTAGVLGLSFAAYKIVPPLLEERRASRKVTA
jgi:hypothetical protein